MADAREVLEIMRDVAKSRIDMLREGVTFHGEEKRNRYLHEYEAKLRDIERLLRRYRMRVVRGGKDDPPEKTE